MAAALARATGLTLRPSRLSCPAIPHIGSLLDSGSGWEAPTAQKLHATVKVVVRTRELAGEVRQGVVAGDERARHGERIARQGDRAGDGGAGEAVPGQPDRV